MNYVILEKAKPYVRTRRGKLERVKGYTGRSALSTNDKKKILAEKLEGLSGEGWVADIEAKGLGLAMYFHKPGSDSDKGECWTLLRRDELELSSFRLSPSFQGKRIASVTLENLFSEAKKLGYKSVKITANGTVGMYAWAVMGFDFTDDSDRKYILEIFKAYLNKKNIIINETQFKHSWDIAGFRVGKEKVGKEFMLKKVGGWYGGLSLDSKSLSWKIFSNYVKTARRMR